MHRHYPLALTPEDGWIAGGWCVSEGDPAGNYVGDIARPQQLPFTSM
jgi:hypothetical protein